MTATSTLDIIILAAGKGSRMRSALPKVLQPLAGRPVLAHVLATAQSLDPRNIFVVVGHQAPLIEKTFPDAPWKWIEQKDQKGTGHAVTQVLPFLEPKGRTLILYGDVPLITLDTLTQLIYKTAPDAIGVLTAEVDFPEGFGRILRDDHGDFISVVEQADITPEQELIQEINTGFYVVPNQYLHKLLPKIDNDNAQKEYYLPTLLALANNENIPITTVDASSLEDIHGINDRRQLFQAERLMQKRLAIELASAGVTMLDPTRLDIRGTLAVAEDVTLDVNVIISGNVSIDEGSYIGPHCSVKDSQIGKNVTIKSHCVIDGATIADNCEIGPFAHLRPGTVLESEVRIGNFVEVKKSTLGSQTKVNHLSYVGDAEVGKDVNIGAGTITCNYNGVKKQVTRIHDHAFIGSNTSLVAPVTIGKNAVIGAGSVITEDAPADQLTLSRSEQKSVEKKKPAKDK